MEVTWTQQTYCYRNQCNREPRWVGGHVKEEYCPVQKRDDSRDKKIESISVPHVISLCSRSKFRKIQIKVEMVTDIRLEPFDLKFHPYYMNNPIPRLNNSIPYILRIISSAVYRSKFIVKSK